MKSLAVLLLVVLALATYSSALCTVAGEIDTEEQHTQHEVEKKLLEGTAKVAGTQEQGGSPAVDTHHDIPRNQWSSHTGGAAQEPSDGGGDTTPRMLG